MHNFSQTDKPPKGEVEYDIERAFLIARLMVDINMRGTAEGQSFVLQYILQKGLKKFGDEGRKAAVKEADQLHNRNCFTPISVHDLTPEEKRKAQQASTDPCGRDH